MKRARHARIGATLGPASRSPGMVKTLAQAGVDVFRLNFSHGDQADHVQVARHIRRQAGHHGRYVGILADLQGPKIRTGVLKDDGIDYAVGTFPFSANGRARAANETDGYVKILSDAKTDRILGAHIIGPGAGDLIHEICVAMDFGASAQDLALTCHAHPTHSEAIKEAAMAVTGKPIHR